MKIGSENTEKFRWLIIVSIIILSVYLGFKFLLPLIIPFVFAYFIAWIIRPVTEFLCKRLRFNRMIGGTLSLLLFVTLICIGLCYLTNALVKEAIALLKNLPVYLNIIEAKLDHICAGCDKMFGLSCGTMHDIVLDNIGSSVNKLKTSIIPRITGHTISYTIRLIEGIGVIIIVLIAALLIAKDLPDYKEKLKRSSLYRDVHKVTAKLSDAGIAYLRAQLIIAIISAVICILGLLFLKNPYAIMIGIGIAIFDAFPVLGSGLILVPWSIIVLINGDIYSAAILMTIFLILQISREVLEPKLIGNRIGVKPLFTLIAIYVGIKLFGFAGFFLGPIGLIIIITILQVLDEKRAAGSSKDIGTEPMD